MNNNNAGRLYDALFSFESRFRNGAYPIHKSLAFEDAEVSDIYDWIIRSSIVPNDGEVMDAGCGVGFGVLRLAAESGCNVTGISVSAGEIEQASRYADGTSLRDRVRFKRMSYDDLEEDEYDLIVAVESLKHSENLPESLRSLARSVKPGGRLVIVEDLYCGSQLHQSARQMAADWGLAGVYKESDYLAVLDEKRVHVVDLTGNVNVSSRPGVAARQLAIQLRLKFGARKHEIALKAFRGGLHLQTLYRHGLMQYKSMVFSKTAAVRR